MTLLLADAESGHSTSVNADAELAAVEPHCPLMMFPHSLTFTLPSLLIIPCAHLHNIQNLDNYLMS